MQLRKSLIAASISGALALGTAQSAHADLAYAFSLLSVDNLKVHLVPDAGDAGGQSINEVFVNPAGFAFESETRASITGQSFANDSDGDFDAGPSPFVPDNDVGQACVSDGGSFVCPPENSFGPASPGPAPIAGPDASEGAFSRSDARFNSTVLGGSGVSFETVAESQSFGTGRASSTTSGSIMRWDFQFEIPPAGSVEEGATSNWALRFSYDSLLTTFAEAIGPGSDTASVTTTFTIQVSGNPVPFVWPGSAVTGDEPFASSTNETARPGDGAKPNCQAAGLPAPPGFPCTSHASSFNFWSGDVFEAGRQYNLQFSIATVATATTVSTEPSTVAVLGLGLFAAGAAARRRKLKKA